MHIFIILCTRESGILLTNWKNFGIIVLVKGGEHMADPWELLQSDELKLQMRLVGTDKKYYDGDASDFEKFRELCSAFHLLKGNQVAEKVLSKLSAACGREIYFEQLCRENAKALWLIACNNYCDENLKLQTELISPQKYAEKDNIIAKYQSLNTVLENAAVDDVFELEKICNTLTEHDIFPLFIHFKNAEFTRPNRYFAGLTLQKISTVKKCNNSEYNALLCQVIFELFFTNKSKPLKLILSCDGDINILSPMIKYFCARGLSARIFVHADKTTSVNDIKQLCALSEESCYITPMFSKKEIDTWQPHDSFLQSLARVYPIGAISFLQ